MKLKLFLAVLLCGMSVVVRSQLNPELVQIPMRDGESLAAHVYLPNESGSFPVILIQTPYNKQYYANVGLPLGIGEDIESSPYAFVITDWRCFFGSLSACGGESTRGEDGFDTIEWIADQEWCNGRVGTWGPSALGNVQFDTAVEQSTHHICAVPVVPSPRTYYSIYYPGGALRTEYFESLSAYYAILGGFSLVIQNPYQNLIWGIAEAAAFNPADITIPMFLVGGWYDHNTEENLDIIADLRSQGHPSAQDLHKIIMGPWVHGGTGQANVGSSLQGQLEYPEAAYRDQELALEFFERYLLEVENGWESRPVYTWFRMGENVWLEDNTWPPQEGSSAFLYLTEEGELGSNPSESGSVRSFAYNPEDPSPTIGGKTLSFELDQGPYDQRFGVEDRDDALVFSTEVLESPVVIEGQVEASLFVSTDRPDTDFTLRLTDVYPDGRSMLLGESIQRLRFRSGNYTINGEEFAEPGEFYGITLKFDHLSHRFEEGHQIRLIVSSSNYPRFNRNMNTGEEMYPGDDPDVLVDPLIAQNSVSTGVNLPSYIQLPLGIPTNVSELIAPDLQLVAYPNPCSTRIYFSPEYRGDYLIYDSSGKEVHRGHGLLTNLDVSGFASGSYILVPQSGKYSPTPFVVE